MNTLEGTIRSIDSSQHASLVEVYVGEDSFSVLLLETPESAGSLREGVSVTLVFKEFEVIIGKGVKGHLGLINQWPAVVRSIQIGAILSEVKMVYKDKELMAIVPTKAVEGLKLQEGETIDWFVKVNEISLQWKTDNA